MTLPYLFWNYDDTKQNKVIQVLKRREEVLGRNENVAGGTGVSATEEEEVTVNE